MRDEGQTHLQEASPGVIHPKTSPCCSRKASAAYLPTRAVGPVPHKKRHRGRIADWKVRDGEEARNAKDAIVAKESIGVHRTLGEFRWRLGTFSMQVANALHLHMHTQAFLSQC